MARFDGRVALVTGGGSGIGEAVSTELAADGAAVLVTDIDLDAATRVVEQISSHGGTASAFQLDTVSPEQHEAAVAFAVETYGGLNYAVNNAGIAGTEGLAGEISVADWDRVVAVNLSGVSYGMRAQIPAMLNDAAKSSIVNMASVHGTVAAPGHGAYTATKHAVVGITKNAAVEYGEAGLRINAVGPGYIWTPLLANNLDDEARAAIAAKHPLNRLGTAAEVSALTCFLLSDSASFITGSYHLVDGGYTAL